MDRMDTMEQKDQISKPIEQVKWVRIMARDIQFDKDQSSHSSSKINKKLNRDQKNYFTSSDPHHDISKQPR